MSSKILLLYPPQAIPDQPYSSLPSLTAFLRHHGYEVEQRDISIEAYHLLLSPERLQQSVEKIEAQLPQLLQNAHPTEAEQKQISALKKALLVAPHVIKNIESAKQATRDPKQFYDLKKYSWAQRLLERGLELISAEFYPTVWSLDDLRTSCFSVAMQPGPKLKDFLAFARNEKENIFLAYLRDHVLPEIKALQPGLIGISVTYPSQMIAAITLADLLKSGGVSAHICIGGARVCYDRLWNRPEIFSLVDSVVVGEGEQALLSLIQKLETGDADWSSVPNLVYAREGVVIHSPISRIEDVNALPTPDWNGMPLKKYFAPDLIPMLPTTRGCYWGKCAFCTVSEATSLKYRPRRIELVLQDMCTLYEQHGATHFFLSADAEPPKRMEALAAAIESSGEPFTWQTETRFSPPLSSEACRQLYAGGCRYLIFGLESANQRILDLMIKGTNVSMIEEVIHHCAQAGIGINLQTIMGFPTETKEEAKETVDFMIAHEEDIDTICISPFTLQPGSLVDRNPSKYGITHIHREAQAESDIVLGYNYQVGSGVKQGDILAEVEFHSARLKKYYRNPSALISITTNFLYFEHYGAQGLKKLKRNWFPSASEILAMRPQADSVVSTSFSTNGPESAQVFVFNTLSGGLLTVDSQTAQLLALCDGKRSIGEIADEFTSQQHSEKDFIVGYSRALSGLKKLLEFGILQGYR